MKKLAGKKIALLAENFYEDLELWYPLLFFKGLGAEVVVVGPGTSDTYTSKHGFPSRRISPPPRSGPRISMRSSSPAVMPPITCGATRK